MEVVPKKEVEVPSTLNISEHVLPTMKDWKVGERYLVQLEIELNDQNTGSMGDPNDSGELRSLFKVLGAKAAEYRENDGMAEMGDKVSGKEAFIRAIRKLIGG